MCTKTSHHSLRMTSAGIITPIVCNDWCMWSCIPPHRFFSAVSWTWQWNFNASCLIHGELLLSIDGRKENYRMSTSLHSPQLTRYKALVLLQIRIWHDLTSCLIKKVCGYRSQQLCVSICRRSYLQMRRTVNTVPPDTDRAMAAEGVETPGGLYLE